jgi:CRP-like cAMP-binding protein
MIVIMLSLKSLILAGHPQEYSLATRETLFRLGEQVTRLYVVLEGDVALERLSTEGQRLILQRARRCDVLAEASLFSATYHCDAVALTPARVAGACLKRLRAASRDNPMIMETIARHLAGQVQHTRARAEILSFKRVSERLDAWLVLNAGKLPVKGDWHALADELRVSAEALYRELARRRTL